jgi:triosephosphate isomerase
LQVIGAQCAGSVPATLDPALLVLAYEPVWAIGSGLIPTLAQIAEVHSALRAALAARFGTEAAHTVRLLYGGSVKPDNAAEVFGVADVDGALVGGASLNAQDFSAIVQALAAA